MVRSRQTGDIGRIMVLEAIQNIPLIVGFIIGHNLWPDNATWALVSMFLGSLLSALSMIPTEGRIFEGHRETFPAVVANVFAFFSFMLLLTLYFRSSWSSWITDLVGGLVLGIALSTVQDVAAQDNSGLIRGLALALSISISLLVIRFVTSAWSPFVSIMIVTIWFTLVMGFYKIWLRAKRAAAPEKNDSPA